MEAHPARRRHNKRIICGSRLTPSSIVGVVGVSLIENSNLNNHSTSPSSSTCTTSRTSTSSHISSHASTPTAPTSDVGALTPVTPAIAAGAFFPISNVSSGWSVSASKAPKNVNGLNLTHNTFIVHKETRTSSRPVVTFKGKTAIKAHMAKGSLDPGTLPAGGFSFYTPGPPRVVEGSSGRETALVDLTKGTEMTFSYSIYFEVGYAFNLGGKLPGLYGGTTEDIAATCSGGRHDPRCFSARLMWRPEGAGELYLYIPPGLNSNDEKCGKTANRRCETAYGASVGRGTWTWKTGVWQTVSQRILLNTPGKGDGEAQVYIDGRSVLKVKGITWRSERTSVVRGAQMQIFFGGHEDEWRSPKDQDVHFADLSAAIIR
ncbi:hypothetical protein FRB96_003177 [Tulasnella sp. 330]|nr:hypothetical protein FRB96_003177 [Tulasnella sp. 330]